jgi:phenol 2-monooxygenase (NADPH)
MQEILQTLNLRHKLDELGHRLSETAFWTVDEAENFSRGSVGQEVVHRKFLQPSLRSVANSSWL